MPQAIRIPGAALCAVAALALPVAAAEAAAATPVRGAPSLPPVAAGPLSPVTPQPGNAAPPEPQSAAEPQTPASPSAQPATATAQPAVGAAPGAITVTSWGFSRTSPRGMATPGPTVLPAQKGPLYVWMVLGGNQAAIAQMQSGAAPAIQIHWISATPAVSAPNEVTNLTVGRPGLASVLASEVQRTGHFTWHTWARKDTLSPGRWIVSLTDGSGQPLQCAGPTPHPCQISLEVGAG